jgi:hypothetical protein
MATHSHLQAVNLAEPDTPPERVLLIPWEGVLVWLGLSCGLIAVWTAVIALVWMEVTR